MTTKKITLNELRTLVKQIIKEERMLNEAADTDLELKSVAKQIFSVLKKYGLKPTYTTGDWKSTFSSKPPIDKNGGEKGYGGRIVIDENGILAVAVYNRGILQSISRGGFPGVNKNEVNNSSDDPSNERNKSGLIKALKILQQDIYSKIGKEFEVISNPNPNNYGEYVMQIRLKQQQPVSEGLKLRNYLK